MDEYQKQAIDFLEKTGSSITVVFDRFDRHFEGDEHERDIYNVTITRGGRSYSFRFGQSIVNSGTWKRKHKGVVQEISRTPKSCTDHYTWKRKNPVAPEAYDILSCLTKFNPGTFEDFCSDYGYDTDSLRAEKTYRLVVDEYLSLAGMYSESELAEMAEI